MSDDRILATEYLLGELDADARAEVDQRLQHDDAFRASVEGLRPVVSQLESLPDVAWNLPGDEVPARRAGIRAPARRRLMLAAAGAAVAVVAGTAGYALRDVSPAAPAGPSVALRPLAGADPRAHATAVMTGHGGMVVEISDLPAAPPGHYYELWLLGSRRTVVGLTSFGVSGSGRTKLKIQLPVDPTRFAYLDVSVQAVAGSPRHSGHSVLRAPLT